MFQKERYIIIKKEGKKKENKKRTKKRIIKISRKRKYINFSLYKLLFLNIIIMCSIITIIIIIYIISFLKTRTY